jgi:hypothetical protein
MARQTDDLLSTAQRRRDVLQLREAGATYEAIADALREKYGADRLPEHWSERYAHKDVKRELKKVQGECRESAETVRDMELRRLDRMLRGLWPDAVEGDTQAIDRVLKIMARRADLLGLDAPERFEQAVSFAESDDYQEARTEMMQALQGFPEARAALANTLTGDDGDESPT